MPTAPLYSAAGERIGDAELNETLFGRAANEHLVHLAVVRELANRRQGTHDTKSRHEVRGGGKKPYRQKGTGRARQGSTRAPHWRHGGIVHGPTPRSYEKEMPKKMRRAALLAALSGKAADGAVVVIEDWQLEAISTKAFRQVLNRFDLNGKTMLVVAEADEKLALSARNVPDLDLRVLPGLSTYEVVAARTLLFTRAALDRLQQDQDRNKQDEGPEPDHRSPAADGEEHAGPATE
jgi:large subunit ribosomal protein L4